MLTVFGSVNSTNRHFGTQLKRSLKNTGYTNVNVHINIVLYQHKKNYSSIILTTNSAVKVPCTVEAVQYMYSRYHYGKPNMVYHSGPVVRSLQGKKPRKITHEHNNSLLIPSWPPINSFVHAEYQDEHEYYTYLVNRLSGMQNHF